MCCECMSLQTDSDEDQALKLKVRDAVLERGAELFDGTVTADEAKAKILSGESNVFDGVMETNTGDTVGEDGGTLDDATITGGINWYYKNVEVLE